MLSRLWLFMTLWTVASQDTLQLKLSDKNQKKVKKKVLILFTSGHGDLGWTGATPWSLGRPGSPVCSVGGWGSWQITMWISWFAFTTQRIPRCQSTTQEPWTYTAALAPLLGDGMQLGCQGPTPCSLWAPPTGAAAAFRWTAEQNSRASGRPCLSATGRGGSGRRARPSPGEKWNISSHISGNKDVTVIRDCSPPRWAGEPSGHSPEWEREKSTRDLAGDRPVNQ